MSGPDVLEIARQRVLEDGQGLTEDHVLDELRDAALVLALAMQTAAVAGGAR